MKRRERRARYYRKVSKETQKHVWRLQQIPHRSDDTIDHIVPISYGFKQGIPARLIGSFENLEWVTLNENIHKSHRLTEKGRQLLERWGYD